MPLFQLILKAVNHYLPNIDMLIFYGKIFTKLLNLGFAPTGLNITYDQDPQEPDSQRESAIKSGQVTQEPSFQSKYADKGMTLTDNWTNPDTDQGSSSLSDNELGMQLTVYNATSTLDGIRSHAIEQDTQEPTIQSTGEVPYVQVPEEPSVQSTEEYLRLDVAPILVEPITSRPMDLIPSGKHSDTLSLISAI